MGSLPVNENGLKWTEMEDRIPFVHVKSRF